MKILYFYFLLILNISLNSVYAMELSLEDSIEKYRPGNIYEKNDTQSYPKATSAQDCFQLCASLIESEKEFWKEALASMLEETPKMGVVVDLIRKHKLDLKLRLTILTNSTYNDLYQMHSSYETIIKDIEQISKIIHGISIPESFKKLQGEINFIKEKTNIISEENSRIRNNNLVIRGLTKSTTIGKKFSDIREEQKDKFLAKTEDIPAKYSLCDVEYVTDVFFPMIEQILIETQETLSNKLMAKKRQRQNKKRIQKTKNQDPRKNTPPSLSLPSSAGAKALQTTLTTSKEMTALHPVMATPSLMEASSSLVEDLDAQDIVEDVAKISPIEIRAVFSDAEATPVLLEMPENSVSTSKAEEGKPLEEYSLRPWEQYESTKITTKNKFNTDKGETKPQSSVGDLILSDEASLTAKRLLGWGDATSCDKVRTEEYVALIKELKGSVWAPTKNSKCIHYAARSLTNQQWFSVTMHKLHQDEPDFIPRNTPYWQKAKKLLTYIELSEKNLKA